MSYSVRFADGSPESADWIFSLATTRGLKLLGDWVDSLPEGEYPALVAFLEDGELAGTDTLARELAAAIEVKTPPKGVADTLANLIELVGVGDPDETASIEGEGDDGDEDGDDDP